MNAQSFPIAKLRLGRIVTTPHVLNVISNEDILTAIGRHQAGDWGIVSDEDRRANDLALENCTRILSAYCARKGVKFWLLTEADRSITTVLLPEDY